MTERAKILSDDEIVELYWQRDEDAIRRTDEKYGRFLYGIAYNILGDRCDCEECQNDTYVKVWGAIPPTRPKAFRAYIAQIVRRIALNRYKENNRKGRIPSELTLSLDELYGDIHGDIAVEDEYRAREVGEVISDYIRALPEKRRFIFMSRYYFAEPVGKIAETLNISESGVYKELTAIRRDMRLYLERNEIYI